MLIAKPRDWPGREAVRGTEKRPLPVVAAVLIPSPARRRWLSLCAWFSWPLPSSDVKTFTPRVNSAPVEQALAATDQWDNLILCFFFFSQKGTVVGLLLINSLPNRSLLMGKLFSMEDFSLGSCPGPWDLEKSYVKGISFLPIGLAFLP